MCSNHNDTQNVILEGNPGDDVTQCEPVSFKARKFQKAGRTETFLSLSRSEGSKMRKTVPGNSAG